MHISNRQTGRHKSVGISALVSSVLLLAVAVSIAGIYSSWAPELAQDATKEAADQANNQITCRNAGFNIRSVSYDITGNLAEVEIINTGTINLYDDLTLVALNMSEVTGQKTLNELEVGDELVTELRSEKIPETIIASSSECPEKRVSTDSINVSQ
ncbi:MAG: hypothetical protein H8Z69_05650 [Nanohaloarchaea archaeon]|nr:hypothetical protein [Candidatus Nanohaloarchaea archaeon]